MRAKKVKSFDGISIRGKEIVMGKGHSKFSLFHSIIQIVLIDAVLFSIIFGFATGLKLPVDRIPLIGAIIFFGLICWGIFRYFKAGVVVLLPILATYIYAGYKLFKELENGFWQIENYFIILMNKYYGTHAYTFLVDDYTPAKVITLLLIFAALPLAMVLSLIILNKASHFLYYPITLPFIIFPFVVGHIPSTASFATYIAATFGIFVLGNRVKVTGARTKEEKAAMREQNREIDFNHYYVNIMGSFLLFCGVLLLFVMISIFFTEPTYNHKMNVPKVKKQLQVKIENFDVKDIADHFGFLNNGKIVIFHYYTASGGLNEGKLGGVGKLAYDNKTDIIIDALENSPTIYLKGFIGSTYSRNAWTGLSYEGLGEYEKYKELWKSIDMEAGDQTGGLVKLLANIDKNININRFHEDVMDIQNIGANDKYIYVPYYSSLMDNMNMIMENSAYVKSKVKSKNYSLSFYADLLNKNLLTEEFEKEFIEYKQNLMYKAADPNLGEKLSERLDKYSEVENEYRTFIQRFYTQVPDAGLYQLKADMTGKYAEMIKKYGEEKALGALTIYIRSYVQKNTVYSLSPGTLPNGKDFVEYFLYEKKQGFCTHYASAAALAFRFAGVPARYVEGYVAKPTNIRNGKSIGTETIMVPNEDGSKKKQDIAVREVRISDAGAHSWVEVYKEGWGWVPVEMTPGYDTEDDSEFTGKDEITPSATPTPQVSVTPTVPIDKDLDRDKNVDTTANNTAKKTVGYGDIVRFMMGALLSTIALLLTIGFIMKIYHYIIFKQAESGKRTLILYRKVKYLLRMAGIPLQEDNYKLSALIVEDTFTELGEREFIQFIEIALKARFGYAPVTPKEEKDAYQYYHLLKITVYGKISAVKKILCSLYYI